MKIIVLFVSIFFVIFDYPTGTYIPYIYVLFNYDYHACILDFFKGVQSTSIDGGKIANGDGPAGPGGFPYGVSVSDNVGQHICGG